MQLELMEIAKQGQIDQGTAGRLQACMDSEFRYCPIRYFGARKAIIVTGSSEFLSIRISGFGESFRARQLTCCNIANPENLEVRVAEREMVLQSVKDPNVFYVRGGVASICGSKYSDVAKDLDTPAESLEILPKKDPDVVQIDNQIYRQTGTVYVNGPFYVVIIER